ncbi:hypothetical protein C8R43DRAFT_307901 [Mycena crocata]|nr:hypothetical protein C8R43DRAFT_307901 [Mycena crocata]
MPPKRIKPEDIPTLESIKAGSISALTKRDLVAIALALDIIQLENINKENVPEIKASIIAALRSPKFCNDERFLKFSVYRPSTTGGASLRSSADKAKEDAAAQKEDVVPTGANMTLFEQKAKADPPPQHRRLVQLEGGDIKENEGKTKSPPSSPLSAVTGSDNEEHTVVTLVSAAIKPASSTFNRAPPPETEISDLSIKVIFNGIGTTTREAWVTPIHRKDIVVYKTPDGKYTTFLDKVLLAGVSNLSPGKELKWKLSIAGTSGPYGVGTLENYSTGNLPAVLALPEANICFLSLKPDTNLLHCEVFLEARRTEQPSLKDQPKLKPLDLARARAKATENDGPDDGDDPSDDGDDWPDNLKDPDFLKFLNAQLGGKPDGYGRALTNVGQMLVRYKDLTNAVATCDEGWKSHTAGFPWRVPSRYAQDPDASVRQFTNRPFKKADLERAFQIGHTIASKDRELFTHKHLGCAPLAQEWIDGTLNDPAKQAKFVKMTRTEYVTYLQECRDDAVAEMDRKRRLEIKAKRRQSKAEAGSDSSGTDEEKTLRRKLKKIKLKKEAAEVEAAGSSRKARLNSNELDG